ncbi:hypothetical protein ACFSQ7_20505 [Paenibacillus rhizoplanae]
MKNIVALLARFLEKNVTGFCRLLHHLQEFRCLEQVRADLVAYRAGFQYGPLILGSIVALLAAIFLNTPPMDVLSNLFIKIFFDYPAATRYYGGHED